MATAYSVFDSTPANLVADLKTKIALSSDWTNITGNIMKATTTRGAEMVVDLTDAAITSNRLQLAVYRTHNGTTGVDKINRYVTWNDATPATSTVVHVVVSAGKEHLYFSVEGPRAGETGAREGSTYGSAREAFAMCDLVPYHGSDTVPAIFLAAHTNQNVVELSYEGWVSRNAANNASWVRAVAATLTTPNRWQNGGVANSTLQPNSQGDNKYYVWPYVIIENAAGLRGRLNNLFWAGNIDVNGIVPDYNIMPGVRITYNSAGYTFHAHERGIVNGAQATALGFTASQNTGSAQPFSGEGRSVVVAIPNGL